MANWLRILRQPSSVRGIVMVLAAVGVQTDVASLEAIVTGAMALSGLIGIGTDDAKGK